MDWEREMVHKFREGLTLETVLELQREILVHA